MKHVQKFFSNIKRSFYDPAFYQDIRTKRLSHTLYLIAGIMCVVALSLTVTIGMAISSLLIYGKEAQFVDTYYPNGLELTIRNAQFSTNVEEPFAIPVPPTTDTSSSPIRNILVIDTIEDLTLSEVRDHSSFVVITKTGLAIMKQSGEIKFMSLQDFKIEDTVITKELVKEWVDIGLSFVKIAALPLLLLLLIFTTLFLLGFYVVLMLLGALLVLLIARIKGISLTYRESYILGMHALIPGIVIGLLFSLFAISLPGVVGFLIFIIVILINLKKHSGSETMPIKNSEPTQPSSREIAHTSSTEIPQKSTLESTQPTSSEISQSESLTETKQEEPKV